MMDHAWHLAMPVHCHSKRGAFALLVVGTCLVSMLSGCATAPAPATPSVEQILELYAGRLQDVAAQNGRREGEGIITIEVSQPEGLVDLEVRDASLMEVIRRLLESSGRPYRIAGAPIEARVSETLRRVPLEEACMQLLSSRGARCFSSDGLLVAELPGADAAAAARLNAEGDEVLVTRIPLRNLTSARAAKILEGLYSDAYKVPPPIHFAIDDATNTVALTGPASDVARASRFLAEADVGVEHVMIEANIFAVESSAIERLGAELSGASGAFSNVAINLGALLSGGIRFSHLAGADNVTAFTAMIDVLLATDSAHVIARPFVGVVSGERATIAVTNDRQVAVLSETGFAPVTTTVSSGVQLGFGAVIRPGGMIRLDLTVEESTFVPTVEGAVSEVARAKAATIMEVPSGQSVVIGGLALRRASESKVGVPWLRDIPVLGLLFGSRGETRKDAQLIVVVTPRQWRPGMDDHPPPLGDATSRPR